MRSLLFKFCLRRGVKISSLEISGNEAVDNIVNVRLFKGISTAGSIKSDLEEMELMVRLLKKKIFY